MALAHKTRRILPSERAKGGRRGRGPHPIPSQRLYLPTASLRESWTASRSPDRCNPLSVPGVFPLALPPVSLTCLFCFFSFVLFLFFVYPCPRGDSWAASLPGSTGFTRCRGAAQFTGPLGFLSFLSSCRDSASSLRRAYSLTPQICLGFFPSLLSAINDQNPKYDMTEGYKNRYRKRGILCFHYRQTGVGSGFTSIHLLSTKTCWNNLAELGTCVFLDWLSHVFISSGF